MQGQSPNQLITKCGIVASASCGMVSNVPFPVPASSNVISEMWKCLQ
jgi:hypothetical protein